MWPNLLSRIFSADRERQEYYDKAAEFMRLPIAEYLTEAIIRYPDGDLFTFRDYVQRNPPQLVDADELANKDLPKCNEQAAKIRQEGNKWYKKKEYADALKAYNESICWARTDSEDLAIGYANRSAVHYEMEEYEFSLANIALAKKHNYPQRLLPKLEARERNCKSKIEAGEHRSSKPYPKLVLNVELNPKIPFVAKGIVMKELPKFGRSMVADVDFKAGDVILHEKPMAVALGPDVKYYACQYCATESVMTMIPCPHCVSAMYCNEDCLKKGWKATHRFECGIYDKLATVPFECSMGPKMFFYGLGLFHDDVKKMMQFCKTHGRTGSNPFDLDYTKDDPVEAFKVFHMAKLNDESQDEFLENLHRIIAAINYLIYMKHPLVRSLFVSKAQKNFLLKYIFDYSRVITGLTVIRDDEAIKTIFTVANVCNHSCDPNAHIVFRSGQAKFIVIRPISKGEQICISYGPVYGVTSEFERFKKLQIYQIKCACEVCNKDTAQQWATRGKRHPQVFHQHLSVVDRLLRDESLTNLDKINAMKQFIQRYAYVHPLDEFSQVLHAFRMGLNTLYGTEMYMLLRERALAES